MSRAGQREAPTCFFCECFRYECVAMYLDREHASTGALLTCWLDPDSTQMPLIFHGLENQRTWHGRYTSRQQWRWRGLGGGQSGLFLTGPSQRAHGLMALFPTPAVE
jgi:hypothetical protein